jgi:hypothetical protein
MARIGQYRTAADAAPAAWVAAGLRGFAASVLSLVPAGFQAYARVFHPAGRRDPDRWTAVPWRAVAEANGRVAHRAMQWCSLVGSCSLAAGGKRPQPGVWDDEPDIGCLPRELVLALADLLAGWTSTPDRCWFAVWEGFGALAPPVRAAPSFLVPQRRMLLLGGPIGAVGGSLETEPWWQTPNLWWPDDRAWCVATAIDLQSTYVGGNDACIRALLDRAELEATAVEPTDGIAHNGDRINPPAPH